MHDCIFSIAKLAHVCHCTKFSIVYLNNGNLFWVKAENSNAVAAVATNLWQPTCGLAKQLSFTLVANTSLTTSKLCGPQFTIVDNLIYIISGPQSFLSATQIWVWWTPRDPSFKQPMFMKNVIIIGLLLAVSG